MATSGWLQKWLKNSSVTIPNFITEINIFTVLYNKQAFIADVLHYDNCRGIHFSQLTSSNYIKNESWTLVGR